MVADSLRLLASRGPVPDAPARRQFPAVALLLLLLAVLTALAPRLHNAPVDLAPMWLGAGVATGLALRLPSWSATGLLAAVMWLGGAIAREQGLPVPAPAVLAAMAVVSAVQARFSACCCRRLLGDPLQIPHRSSIEQLGLGVLFALRCVLVPALLAGVAIGVLQWQVGGPALLPLAAVKLGLLHAAASSLSTLLLLPTWLGRSSPLPSRVVAGLLWLASAALAWLAAGNPEALHAAPVIALAAGYFGGWRLAAPCVATIAASLMLGVNVAHLPPFEGPDGFVVLLLVVWRLAGMGFIVSVWSERRQQGRAAAAARPGALQCSDPEQLLRHFRASLARLSAPTGHHGWICIDLGALQSDGDTSAAEPASATAPLLSSRRRAAMRAAAQVLRPGDGVLPLAGDTLLVVLPGLSPNHLLTVAARIKAALGRGDDAAALGGQLIETRVMGEHAVQCLLQSQVYFGLEGD